MTRELTIGSPAAAHIVWEDWCSWRERQIQKLIDSMVYRIDWEAKIKKLKP